MSWFVDIPLLRTSAKYRTDKSFQLHDLLSTRASVPLCVSTFPHIGSSNTMLPLPPHMKQDPPAGLHPCLFLKSYGSKYSSMSRCTNSATISLPAVFSSASKSIGLVSIRTGWLRGFCFLDSFSRIETDRKRNTLVEKKMKYGFQNECNAFKRRARVVAQVRPKRPRDTVRVHTSIPTSFRAAREDGSSALDSL